MNHIGHEMTDILNGCVLKIIFSMEKIRIMELLLHCADISNCVKPWNIHTKFTGELLEEFFKQVSLLSE